MDQTQYHARFTAPKAGRALVLALHGTGGDENQFFDLAEQLVPDGGVIAPRGDVSEMGAARFFRRTGEGLYDMDDLARATDKMLHFVEAHRAAHPSSPVYAFGYSNGANILAAAFLKQPGLFDRTALLHPLVTWEPQPQPELAGRKVLLTAGRRDPITPWAKSEELIAWLEGQTVDVTPHIHDGGHELRAAEIAALVKFFSG